MEQLLSSKMAELLNVLDQVKRYREIAASMIDFAIIISATAVAVLILNVSRNLWTVFYGGSVALGTIIGNVSILLIILGIVGGILRVTLRVNAVKLEEWKSTLNEGTPGAIKLLQELRWETIFNDIRYAKLGFSLYGIIIMILCWVNGAVFLYLLGVAFLGHVIHLSLNPIAIGLISLVFALALRNKDLRERYEQAGHLDSLLWELRWFESEFRRADFKT